MPEAAALATATRDGRPSLRMVLVKAFDERGFSFHTNYGSRKGRELEQNPVAALLFHWHGLGRQVRVEGGVERGGGEDSDAYFRTRPLGGRLGAWASPQSEVIAGRAELDARLEDAHARFADDPPRPPFWGALLVRAETYEFWQHHEDRLHDRFRYRKEGERWAIDRLAP